MEAVSFPQRKYLLKFTAMQAMRHDRRDELRKFHHVDCLPLQFVCKLAKNHSLGIEVACDLHRGDGRIRPTGGVKAEVVLRRMTNPRNFHLPRRFSGEEL